jgi:hypothetical protein
MTANIIIKYEVGLWAPLLHLPLLIATCSFFERNIVKQINNTNGLYFRYIDDIFIIINWPSRHLLKEIDR